MTVDTLDRRAVAADLLAVLAGTNVPVELSVRPDGAGWTSSGFAVYGMLHPLPSAPVRMLVDAEAGDNTIMQITSVADDPDLAMRVSATFRAHLKGNVPATLGGRPVSQITFPFESGPHRDPDDGRLHYAILHPRIETWG